MMERRGLIAGVLLIALGGLGLSGCGGVKDALGANKYPPDEFTVVAKTPLIIPPDFNLRPPGASNPSPHEVESSQLALQALFPDTDVQLAQRSPGEDMLLRAAGADRVDSDVRSDLLTGAGVIGKGAFTEKLLFTDDIEGDSGVTIEQAPPTSGTEE